jgi:PIN like domain
MRDQFSQFYAPNEDAIATAMKTGLVVPDANVLLNLYRFQSGARDQLFGALEKLSERLWIPYQVALEFHRNRLNVIAEQEAYFGKTEKELADAIEGLKAKFRAFRARIALSLENARDIEETITRLGDLVERVVGEADGQTRSACMSMPLMKSSPGSTLSSRTELALRWSRTNSKRPRRKPRGGSWRRPLRAS